MSVDLADFGHDYRSVNLQYPSAYLLVRNGNPFDSWVPAKCCSVADNAATDCHIVWSGLEQRVVDKAINEWHGWLHTCVRADGQHFEHLLWAANFFFGLTSLFNFANMHLVIGTLSNCCWLYKVQLQHVKPGLVGWMTLNFRYKLLLTYVC